MRIYNLRTEIIVYRRRSIPANGGYVDFPELTFIPDRDLQLATDKVLSFGSLPQWWVVEQEMKRPRMAAKATEPKSVPLPLPKKVEVTLKEELLAPVDDSMESRVFKKKT